MVLLVSVLYYIFNCLLVFFEGLKKLYSLFVLICNNLRIFLVVGEDWCDFLNVCWNII